MSGIEFLINIQQRMNAGNAVTELQRTQNALNGAMQKYGELDTAARKAEQAVAKNAASQAKAAGAVGKAADGGNIAAYRQAVANLERLKAAEAGLVSSSNQAKAALESQAGAVNQLASAYEREKSASAAAATAEKQKAEAEKSAAKKTADDASKKKESDGRPAEIAGEIGGAGRALSRIGGPIAGIAREIGGLARGWSNLAKSIGPANATIAIGAVVFLAVASAVVSATLKLIEFGLASANAARNMQITLHALAGSDAGAKSYGDAIDQVNLKTGVATDRLVELTRALHEAKVPANDIPTALKAIAQQESALGSSDGSQKLIDQLKGGAKSAAELGQEMEKTFGADAAKRANGLDQSIARLKQNIAGLFGSLNIEGFLDGLHRIAQLFDKNTVAGKGLQMLLGDLFGPLLGSSKDIGVTMEGVFLDIEIAIFDVDNAVLRFAVSLKKSFGEGGEHAKGLHAELKIAGIYIWVLTTYAKIWWAVMSTAVDGVITWLGEMTDSVGFVGGAVSDLIDIVIDWASSFGFVADAVSAVKGVASDVANWWNSWSWESLGEAIISGIVNGITSGGSRVKSAVLNLGKGVIGSFAGVIESHSPSRVFHRFGLSITDGAAEGVDEGSARVKTSVDKMIDLPDGKPGKAGRGSGAVVHIHLQLTVGSMRDGAEKVVDILTDVLEGAGFTIGAESDPDGSVPA